MTKDEDIIAIHNQSLGYLLGQAHGLSRERAARAIAESGLHLGQVLILATLRAQRALDGAMDMTQTRLAALSGIEKSSLVLFLDALEKGGWVERRRHPTDRRAYIVHLTDDGARRFETVGIQLYRAEQETMAVLSEAERDQLRGLLARLVGHMRSLG